MHAETSDGRMLAMCNLAKDVNESSPTRVVSGPWADAAGFISPPASIAAGKHNINAALVGELTDMGVVVAFRGTLAVNDHSRPWKERLYDWLQDFEAKQELWHGMFVHSGFSSALDSLWPEVKKLIPDDGGSVQFAGHSKGGAMALLAAALFYQETGRASWVTTFGAARSVGAASAKNYLDMPVHIRRYENAGDIVPLVPPEEYVAELIAQELRHPIGVLDYSSIGEMKFVTRERTVSTHSKFVNQVYQAAAIADHLVHGDIDGIVDAHNIAIGGAYQAAVAPEVHA